MTDTIKQWIADQGNSYLKRLSSKAELTINSIDAHYAVKDFSDGLSKGIEIAQGFAEWIDDYYFIERTKKWMLVDDNFYETTTESKLFTTSQLLEKYIQQLGK